MHEKHENGHVLRSARCDVNHSSYVAKMALAFGLTAAGGLLSVSVQTQAREFINFSQNYPSGTIVIKQSERRLYFTTGFGTAVRYPIAIGRPGMAWLGETYVQGKYIRPAWEAPWIVRRDHPRFTPRHSWRIAAQPHG
jgi:lipoprotein-anchoring transpeptidase ErfK/SrfK